MFPGSLADAGSDVLDWFTMDVAHEVLRTFAGAWPSLGGQERIRHQYWGLDTGFAVEFRGYQLREAEILVTDITRIDRWSR